MKFWTTACTYKVSKDSNSHLHVLEAYIHMWWPLCRAVTVFLLKRAIAEQTVVLVKKCDGEKLACPSKHTYKNTYQFLSTKIMKNKNRKHNLSHRYETTSNANNGTFTLFANVWVSNSICCKLGFELTNMSFIPSLWMCLQKRQLLSSLFWKRGCFCLNCLMNPKVLEQILLHSSIRRSWFWREGRYFQQEPILRL
jgi:hypothetical protein